MFIYPIDDFFKSILFYKINIYKFIKHSSVYTNIIFCIYKKIFYNGILFEIFHLKCYILYNKKKIKSSFNKKCFLKPKFNIKCCALVFINMNQFLSYSQYYALFLIDVLK